MAVARTPSRLSALLRDSRWRLAALWYRRQRLLARTLRLWFEKTSRGQAKLEQRRREEALERKKEAARQRRREVKRRLLEELASALRAKKRACCCTRPAPPPRVPAARARRALPCAAPRARHGAWRHGPAQPGQYLLHELHPAGAQPPAQVPPSAFLNPDPSKTEQLFPRAANGKAPLSGRPASSSATELLAARVTGPRPVAARGPLLERWDLPLAGG